MSRINEVRAAKLEDVKRHAPARLGVFTDAYGARPKARKCIKAFCLDCMGCDINEVKGCTAYACPLWFHRPFSGIKGKRSERTPAQIAATAKGILSLSQKRLQKATAPAQP